MRSTLALRDLRRWQRPALSRPAQNTAAAAQQHAAVPAALVEPHPAVSAATQQLRALSAADPHADPLEKASHEWTAWLIELGYTARESRGSRMLSAWYNTLERRILYGARRCQKGKDLAMLAGMSGISIFGVTKHALHAAHTHRAKFCRQSHANADVNSVPCRHAVLSGVCVRWAGKDGL